MVARLFGPVFFLITSKSKFTGGASDTWEWESGAEKGLLKRQEGFTQVFGAPLEFVLSMLEVLIDLGAKGLLLVSRFVSTELGTDKVKGVGS